MCVLNFRITCILGLVIIASLKVNSQCDEGWYERSDNNQCYHFNTMPADAGSWHDAQSWCWASGGHLTSVQNQEEMTYIAEIASNKSHSGQVWNGFNQLSNKNGDYKWVDGSTANYSHWAPGQPYRDGLHQCVHMELLFSNYPDCFTREDGTSKIKGVINTPEDANPPNTFFLGEWTEDAQGIDLCMEACKAEPQCYSYTFTSTLSSDATWAGHCVGASQDYTVYENDIYAFSGIRTPCMESYNVSGLWYSANCGTDQGFICKKPVNAPGPVTTAPPQPIDSYCPPGYFNIAGGNKCYKAVTTMDDNAENGKTWDEALAECRSGPGVSPDMASIENDLENAEVLSALKGSRYVNNVWLGQYIDVLSMSWVWTDNANPAYTNWAEGKPETENNKTCSQMRMSAGVPGTWINDNCANKNGYVCQTYKDAANPNTVTPNPPPMNCADGWTAYWYGCYNLVSEVKNWQDAENHCTQQNAKGHLVSIHTEMENSAVYAFVYGRAPVWLGFKKTENDVYVWTDGWINRYTNWAADGTEGGDGCVQMLSNGEWKDVDCLATSNFLCKYTELDHLTTPNAVEGYCPENWVHSGTHCYYFQVGESMTWQDAQNHCNTIAGDTFNAKLASIHDIYEDHFIIENLKRKAPSGNAWIGLKRFNSGEDFQWLDGSSYDYEQWAPGQPDRPNTEVSCVEMATGQYAGAWRDVDCAGMLENYACKVIKGPITTAPTTTPPPPTTTPSLPPDGPQTCPGGSEKYGEYCFMFRKTESLRWEMAVDQCVADSGGKATLASVWDETENWFINNRMSSSETNFWIGLFKEGGTDVCFSRNDGKNTVKGLIEHPSEAQPPSTFQFGSFPDTNDEDGIIWCQEQCAREADCYSYTYVSALSGDQNWKQQCVGRNDQSDHETNDLYTYSGYRQSCYKAPIMRENEYQWIDGSAYEYQNWSPSSDQGSNCVQMNKGTGDWNDVSCGTEQAYVCKWREDGGSSTEPIPTQSTTVAVASDCISGDWLLWGEYCYLFSPDVSTAGMSWTNAQDFCHLQSSYSEESVTGNLVSVHSEDENDMVTSELLQRNIENAWIGLYKDSSEQEKRFKWIDNSTVAFQFWADNEPNGELDVEYCVALSTNSSGQWYDTEGCNVLSRAFVCKSDRVPIQRTQPQYQNIVTGQFYSDTGEDFSSSCIVQYAEAMNQKTAQMALHINSLIGEDLCTQLTTSDMMVATASSLFYVDGSQGETSPTFYFAVGQDLVISSVESCAADIMTYTLPHYNWGEPLLPAIPGCPQALFTNDGFSYELSQWLCSSGMDFDTANGVQIIPSTTLQSSLHYGLGQTGAFRTEQGEELDPECTQQYSTDLNTRTYEMVQATNAAIESGALCGGQGMKILTAAAYLIASGTEGASVQNYVLEPETQSTFTDVYICANEISRHLSDHENWVTPILPQIPGCPRLIFNPEAFTEASQNWICVSV